MTFDDWAKKWSGAELVRKTSWWLDPDGVVRTDDTEKDSEPLPLKHARDEFLAHLRVEFQPAVDALQAIKTTNMGEYIFWVGEASAASLSLVQKLEGACAALHNIRNFPHLPHNRDLTFSEALDEVVSLASRALVEIGAIPQEKTND